jgi:hypothetical protein
MSKKVTQYGSHMVMTGVVPPTKTKYITLDTRFRDEYGSSNVANYTISLPSRINDVKSIKLKSIELPISFYNISSNIGNNMFTLSILNKRITIIIPDGQYSAETLVCRINDEIKLMTSPFTSIQFSISNNKGIFLNMCNQNDCIVNFDVIPKNTTCVKNNMTTLGWLLGYKQTDYILYQNSIIEGETFVNLFGSRYLFLIVDEFKNGNPHSFISLSNTSELLGQQILARIQMNYTFNPFGTILIAADDDGCCCDTRQYSNEINIQKLNVRLVDEFGTIMNLNGMDFSFCLEIKHL